MANTQSETPYESSDSTQARQIRRIWKSGLVGAMVGALIGAFFGLVTPITAAAGAGVLIYLPPPSWFPPSVGIWIFPVLGGIEGMIVGYALGAFVGAVWRVPLLEMPSSSPDTRTRR